MTSRSRVQLFIAVTVVAIAVVAAIVIVGVTRNSGDDANTPPPQALTPIRDGDLVALDRDRRHPKQWGRVVVVHGGRRQVGRLTCERVDFRGGKGICLALKSSFPRRTFVARFFDAHQRVTGEISLAGTPSRSRVSPAGRYAASTTFVAGDSYADPGAFSTRTVVYDARAARRLGDLEDFAVTKDGKRIDAPDFNFWGVTWVGDTGRFYATLATKGHHYLVRGDVNTHTADVLRDGVECPSLSPDGKRIAFKARVGDPWSWRFHVLDLATGKETELAEDRAIDDQAAWVDNTTVAYDVDEVVFAVPADGTGTPHELLGAANSPARVGAASAAAAPAT